VAAMISRKIDISAAFGTNAATTSRRHNVHKLVEHYDEAARRRFAKFHGKVIIALDLGMAGAER